MVQSCLFIFIQLQVCCLVFTACACLRKGDAVEDRFRTKLQTLSEVIWLCSRVSLCFICSPGVSLAS